MPTIENMPEKKAGSENARGKGRQARNAENVPEKTTKKRSLSCVSGSKAEQKRTKRKRKTPEQLAILEREFDSNPMPNKEVRDQLSSRLGLTSRQVQIWFQNKRAKVKNSNHASGQASPFQSPSSSPRSSPPIVSRNSRALSFTPENFEGLKLAPGLSAGGTAPHPNHAFFDILAGRGVNQLLAFANNLSAGGFAGVALPDLPKITTTDPVSQYEFKRVNLGQTTTA